MKTLFGLLDAIPGAEDKHLAIALNVSAAAVSGWRAAVDKNRTPRLNDRTRESIQSLLGLSDDYVTAGMEVAVGRMKATVDDLAMAVEVRRALTSQAAGANGKPGRGRAAADVATRRAGKGKQGRQQKAEGDE